MEITIEDVRQLTFELYLSQRENGLLRAENAELKHLLSQQGATDADSSRPAAVADDGPPEHRDDGPPGRG